MPGHYGKMMKNKKKKNGNGKNGKQVMGKTQVASIFKKGKEAIRKRRKK